MQTVAIVGAGLIGCSWVTVFVRAGWQALVWDPLEKQREAAAGGIATTLDDLARYGLVSNAREALQRVHVVPTLEEAVSAADFVQESGPERLGVKRETFARMDEVARPDVVLASSTSAIVASKFTESLTHRERCLVAHPINPPHLVPVVEICGAPWTSQQAISRASQVMNDVGQVPVEVKREIDGFILNRLQVALLTEAFRLVQEGYVTPDDLDRTIADGLGLRWSFMGPFETIELNAPGGIADYCDRYVPWFRRYMADLPPASVWDDANWRRTAAACGPAPSAEDIASKSKWRNARLAALASHKRDQAKS